LRRLGHLLGGFCSPVTDLVISRPTQGCRCKCRLAGGSDEWFRYARHCFVGSRCCNAHFRLLAKSVEAALQTNSGKPSGILRASLAGFRWDMGLHDAPLSLHQIRFSRHRTNRPTEPLTRFELNPPMISSPSDRNRHRASGQGCGDLMRSIRPK
jgi:hypothetical protein